jgi:hypothetical protein
MLMQDIQQKLTAVSPDIKIQPLPADSTSGVMFEMLDPGGSGRPAQHELVRLVAGERDVYRLAYSKQTAQLTDAEQRRWDDLLRSASVERVDTASAAEPNASAGGPEDLLPSE